MKVRADKRRLIPLPGHRGVNGPAEIGQVVRDEVGQVGVLGMVPDLLGRIEVGSIRWQPFRIEPARPVFPEDADRLAVDVPAVQDNDEPTRQMAVKPYGFSTLRVINGQCTTPLGAMTTVGVSKTCTSCSSPKRISSSAPK